MRDQSGMDAVVRCFKALSDPTRLRLVGAMVDRPRCGQDLSTEVGVSPATVSHHLKVLADAGLLTETRTPPYVFYQLDPAALARTVQAVATPGRVRALANGQAGEDDDRAAVLRNFFEGPRLRSIPAQRKKKQIVLDELVRRLPRRREYPEAELNRFIEVVHPDFCTLRRELIMEKLMERKAGVYRLTERGRAAAER
jgi:DNA-binding HxlR family transcriptional regulator